MQFPETVTPELEKETLESIKAKRVQLWAALDTEEQKVIGAVLSRLVEYQDQDGKFIEITHLAGERFRDWGQSMWALISAFGRANQREKCVIYGRRGWIRRMGFEQIGMTEKGVPIFVKELDK